MDLLDKIDLMVDTTVAGDVATNTAKGKIDIIGGKCPDGQVYDKIKKVCVPAKNETSVVGGSYISGTTTNIVGSGQTRAVGRRISNIVDLNRKEKVKIEDKDDDPTKENINRDGLKFNKLTGAYTPSFWNE
jgi:hypothetical protein